MKEFEEKVALVTGAAGGIGRATALEFAQKGAAVMVSDTNEDHGQQTVRLIEEAGGTASFFGADISQASEVKALIEATLREYKRLNYAYNNAGIEGVPSPTADCSIENWDQTINTNLKGVWLCMKEELPIMVGQGQGAIVNCSSVAGLVGVEGLPAYSASKHGVIGLTKTAALEYVKAGVRVNAVCPGAIETPMLKRFFASDPGTEAAIMSKQPIGRVGTPEEIAHLVTWLCSESASFVTGQSIAADGGWTTG